MLGCLCNQTLNLETDAKTLYYMYSLLKLKYSTSVYIFKAQKRLQKLICIFKHPPATVITDKQDILPKNLQIDPPFRWYSQPLNS